MSSTSRLGAREAAQHLLARVRVARDAGVDTLTFGDSHTRAGVNYFQNTPTVARALAEWDPDRPAGCLFLVPMWSPVLIAEQVGTLAAFHPGRFIVQTGLGGGPGAFAAFGAQRRHRGDALDEGIRVISELFAGNTVSSEMFDISDAAVGLVPPDGVEWWIGTMSSAGLSRAGRLGATWYASHGATMANLPRMMEIYRDAFVSLDGAEPTVALRREAVISEDGDRARATVAELLAAGYRGLTSEMVLAGTPDDVAEQLAPLAGLGVDEIMIRTVGVSAAVDLETIELLRAVRLLVGP